jgi:hypothetical protein
MTKSPAKNLQISNCSIATLSHVCNYRVQFCALKGDAQNLPLRRVGNKNNCHQCKYFVTSVGIVLKFLWPLPTILEGKTERNQFKSLLTNNLPLYELQSLLGKLHFVSTVLVCVQVDYL